LPSDTFADAGYAEISTRYGAAADAARAQRDEGLKRLRMEWLNGQVPGRAGLT
jgi:hypothetical protein